MESDSSTEELNLFISNDEVKQEEPLPALTQQQDAILISDSSSSSDYSNEDEVEEVSDFEESLKKRRTRGGNKVETQKKIKQVIRKPPSKMVPKARRRLNL